MLVKKISTLALASILVGTMISGCTKTEEETVKKEVTVKQVLANKDARIAIATAFDKSAITDTLLNNGSIPANYYIAEELVYDENGNEYRDKIGNLGYGSDKAKAAEHWKKAKEELGFDTISMEILTSDSDTSKKIGEFLQSELQTSLEGLTITLKQVPFKQKQELSAKGEFDIVYNSWIADYPDPLTYLDTFVSNSKFAADAGYKNEEYDKLVQEGKNATDLATSWDKYGQAEKILLDDAYLAPVYQSASAYLEKAAVKDIVKSLYGARNSYKWASVEGKDSLNMTSTADIPSLDPSRTSDFYSFDVLNNIMEGLTRVNLDGKVEGGASSEWKVSEDKKTWTFTINKDSKWSNGEPVTAKDFEYAWKRTLNPDTLSEYAFILYDIVGAEDYNMGKGSEDTVGVKALDDSTLEVKLNRPVNYFERLVGFPVFFPQNQKFVEASGDKFGTAKEYVIGNGPFELSTWKLEDQYTMTKSNSYWEKDVVKLQTVNTKISKDASTSINLYEANEIDSADLVAEQIDKYKSSPEYKTNKNATTFFLLMNAREE